MPILDCTFRDGGYYNNWDFDISTVEKYLKCINTDTIEIGFRITPKPKFVGPFAYCKDSFLNTLPLPHNTTIAVMVNANDWSKDLFAPKEQSPVELVRVAVHFDKIDTAKPITKYLKSLGYKTTVNLMQAAGKLPREITKAANKISSWKSVDILYFADSLGSYFPEDIVGVVTNLKDGWGGDLGFHAHNSKGLAFPNTLSAKYCGVKWLDGTVLGIGRGPGNACTEQILDKCSDELLYLILEDFSILKQKYNWGPGILYHLAASYGIHPTYIQEMFSSLNYDTTQIIQAVKSLRGKSSFNKSNMHTATEISLPGTFNITRWLNDRKVLIIGSGPSSLKYKQDIVRFIEKYNPFVICLNENKFKLPIDAHAVCHPTRLATEKWEKPVISPITSTYNYGLQVKSNTFKIGQTSCTIPYLLVFPYALAAVSSAKRIFIVGFDGYDRGDPRQDQMLEVASLCKSLVTCLTPTSYPFNQESIYQYV